MALEDFATLGPQGALIEEIADRMGMPQAGVPRYFGVRSWHDGGGSG